MGNFDHEIKVGSTTTQLKLLRDENNRPLYQVNSLVSPHRNPLRIIQKSWVGGHGKYRLDPNESQFGSNDVYFEGQSIDTTVDGTVFLGPAITTIKENDATDLDSAVVCFHQASLATGLFWLCATTNKIYIFHKAAADDWTAATTAVTGVKSFCTFNQIVYACRDAGAAYAYSTDGDTWTVCTLTDHHARTMVVAPNAAGTADILWKGQANQLTYTTDGRNTADGGAQWSSPAYLGDTNSDIYNVFLLGDNLMAGRLDNLYHYDSNGGVHKLRNDLATNLKTAFVYVTEWQGGVYHDQPDHLGEITPDFLTDIVGALAIIDDIGKVGTTIGLASDTKFVYHAIDEGTNSIIYKGRQVNRNGRLRWEWCPWVFLSTNACAVIGVEDASGTNPRLWFGYGNATGYVLLSDNPLNDTVARFTTSGWVRMSYDYGTNPEWDKLVQSVIVDVAGLASGETLQIKYRKDTDSSTGTECVATGTFGTTNGVVEKNLSAELAFNRIQFEIHLASDTSTATPQVRYFEVRGIEKPETIRVHECVYDAEDTPTRRSETVRTALRNAGTSTTLVRFADHWFRDNTADGGGYVQAILQPGYPEEVVILDTKTRQPQMGLKCRWQEVNFTVT